MAIFLKALNLDFKLGKSAQLTHTVFFSSSLCKYYCNFEKYLAMLQYDLV